MSIPDRKLQAMQSIKDYMKEYKIPQKQIATDLGLNKDYFNRVLCGRYNCTDRVLLLIETYLEEHNYGNNLLYNKSNQ